MKAIIQGVKGARDFYPEDLAFRSWLYACLKRVSESFGYQEYDGPFLEKVDLYAAKSGDELVKEQSFVFQDRGGEYITLRPELTPSLARMIAQKQNELAFPVRWWSFGPFWRYERPQKGRSREFFQWNADLIGPTGAEADAEMVSIAADFLRQTGLKPDQVNIRINNRALMENVITGMNIPIDQIKQVFKLIDRKDKMSLDAWKAFGMEQGFTGEQITNLENALTDLQLWRRSPELVRLFEILEATGLREYVQFDPNIIRGLEYYTGTVFEARDRDGEFRAILGGGRYNNLVADVGGQPVGGMGFAMGDMVIRLVLEKYKCLPILKLYPADVMVTIFDESFTLSSVRLAADLRRAGINATNYPEISKLPKQFKYADRSGVRFIIVLGPDEQAAGNVTVKDLSNGSQELIAEAKLAEYVKSKLAQGQAV